ncbi:exonuclease domain-containing protein [Candidatus Hodgkinia cicadicola]
MRELILDTETTGLTENDRIIELAVMEFKLNKPAKKLYHSYFKPGSTRVSKEAFKIHGVSDEFLKTQPEFKTEANKILKTINCNKLIAHNAEFDKRMLMREFALANVHMQDVCWLDTLELARTLYPRSPISLRTLCKRYKIKVAATKHDALFDCKLLSLVYSALLKTWKQRLQDESQFNKSV